MPLCETSALVRTGIGLSPESQSIEKQPEAKMGNKLALGLLETQHLQLRRRGCRV